MPITSEFPIGFSQFAAMLFRLFFDWKQRREQSSASANGFSSLPGIVCFLPNIASVTINLEKTRRFVLLRFIGSIGQAANRVPNPSVITPCGDNEFHVGDTLPKWRGP